MLSTFYLVVLHWLSIDQGFTFKGARFKKVDIILDFFFLAYPSLAPGVGFTMKLTSLTIQYTYDQTLWNWLLRSEMVTCSCSLSILWSVLK